MIGATTNNGDINLKSSGLTLTQAVNAGTGTGTVRLVESGAASTVSQTAAGTITAGARSVTDSGAAVSLEAANSVGTLAFATGAFTFKQAMAFPLYLTVAWLLWVLTRQAGADALGLAACGLVAVSFAVWLYGRPQRGWFTSVLAVVALALASLALTSPLMRAPAAGASKSSTASGHQAWSAATVAALRTQGRTVFVDFTADWCITCKVNERGALASDKVQAAFAKLDVAVLTADWTTSDPAITKALAQFGRNGVPLYLVYPKGGEPRVLPQVLSPQVVIDALSP